MGTIGAMRQEFYSRLSGEYPSEEIRSFFNILSEKFLKKSPAELVLQSDRALSDNENQQFEDALKRLCDHEPVQYITGETEFFGLPFKVNQHTLIPRPETEELVDWILKDHSEIGMGNFSLLDIGTGSGCIAVTLAKKLKNATVHAVDISTEALQTAQENAALNAVNIRFWQSDILTDHSLLKTYDVIVSNPPYIRELEKKEIKPNVLKYEPGSALFVPNEDPLRFYKAIAALSKTHLKSGGTLYFEINEYLSEALYSELRTSIFKTIEVRKDLFGKDRMIKCTLDE
jgi:release factor glutamine methyltransferase